MSALEIIMIALGLLLLLLSVFLVDHSTNQKEQALDKNILNLPGGEADIRRYVREIVEQEAERTLEDTDEKLSELSNHKIMAVDEFSSQIIEKLDHNHQEAVFLYNMLQNKEKDIKETIGTMSGSMINEVGTSAGQQYYGPAEDRLVPDYLGTQAKAMAAVKSEIDSKPDVLAAGNHEYVLKLYREKKSVMEISKLLGMGQGEVKLIIDLYGH